MRCSSWTYRTIRGDNFTINIANKDADLSMFSKVTMTLRREEDTKEILKESTSLKEKLTTVSFSPQQTQDLEGMYVFDVELSDSSRSNVRTLFVGDLLVEKDVSY